MSLVVNLHAKFEVSSSNRSPWLYWTLQRPLAIADRNRRCLEPFTKVVLRLLRALDGILCIFIKTVTDNCYQLEVDPYEKTLNL